MVFLFDPPRRRYTNLITNPSFETGDFTGWSQNGGTIVTDGVAGTEAAEIAGNAGHTNYALQTINNPTTGNRYQAEVWIKVGTGTVDPALIARADVTFQPLLSIPLTSTGQVRNGFTKYQSDVLTVPANTTYLRLEIYSIHAANPIRIDKAAIYKISNYSMTNVITNPSFETGDTTGWTSAVGVSVVAGGLGGTQAAEIAGNPSFSNALSFFTAGNPGEVWQGDVWVNPGSGTPAFAVHAFDAGIVTLSQTSLVSTGQTVNGFTLYTATHTMPANTAWAVLYLYSIHATDPITVDLAFLGKV